MKNHCAIYLFYLLMKKVAGLDALSHISDWVKKMPEMIGERFEQEIKVEPPVFLIYR